MVKPVNYAGSRHVARGPWARGPVGRWCVVRKIWVSVNPCVPSTSNRRVPRAAPLVLAIPEWNPVGTRRAVSCGMQKSEHSNPPCRRIVLVEYDVTGLAQEQVDAFLRGVLESCQDVSIKIELIPRSSSALASDAEKCGHSGCGGTISTVVCDRCRSY